MRLALVVAVFAAGCGSRGPHGPSSSDDAAPRPDTPSSHDDAAVADGEIVIDAPPDTPAGPDAFPAVLDVRIDCHNTCVLTANPAAINVSAGTSFQVNWINVGDTECDVNKIDQFNHVPLIIGLEPGTSYHDPVHDWCGTQFTGTFDFEIRICEIPSYIPVNCGA
jgi:hypothetical protein